MSHKLPAEGQALEASVTRQMRAKKGLEHQTRGDEGMEVASAQHEVTMQASSSTAVSSLVVPLIATVRSPASDTPTSPARGRADGT